MTNKTNQELLIGFIKANKNVRLKRAIKAGFSTAELYRVYLEGKIMIESLAKSKTKPSTKSFAKVIKTKEKPTIHIVDILDCSGSMNGNKLRGAIEAINNGVRLLIADSSVNYTYTLCHFSSSNDIVFAYDKAPLNIVKNLSLEARDFTALNDAIGRTLTTAQKNLKTGENTLVNIYTDGEENGSREFRSKDVSALIEKLKDTFTVTFIGTDRDVAEVVRNLKIDSSNTLSYDGSDAGLSKSMADNNAARSVYSAKVSAGEDVKTGYFKNVIKK